ncbi:pantoate--beta-alanine ligase [Sporosarcina sp. NCCP-2716]|uniref:pantoate--beta-alanine ligase n=1 Tax=Sporosarcina sp. NCCP-2716 TaxID=2943679 RepID=UPI002041C0CC|nr:pantoate--beta-alanine ligase [Sporosarcina sp. NCCP-2716]
MRTLTTISELKQWREEQRAEGNTVGFVPTMGYLHEGHAELIRQAADSCGSVIVSVFVNPTQFGPGEDFESYPRDLGSDRRVAEAAGAAALFCPSVDEMYPADSGIRITPGPLACRLCGASRPGHFDGVLQVVLKLTNLVQPDTIFFGMKDAQQLAIIESFFRDYLIPTAICRVPTVRESDGLAKSSRNVNLTPAERDEAPAIQRALQHGLSLYRQGKSREVIEAEIAGLLTELTSGTVDYVSLLSYPDLSEPRAEEPELILACAVQFSKARLIDNLIFQKEG